MKFILIWHHGTKEREWKDSGWVYNNRFYPCLYTNDKDGEDKIIGRRLVELEKNQLIDNNPTKNSYKIKEK